MFNRSWSSVGCVAALAAWLAVWPTASGTANDPAAADQKQVEPFEVKGDQLGMTLEAFKRKYHRNMGPGDPPAPFTSDASRIPPDQDNVMLFYKGEYAKLGIVHAATTFPYEAHATPPNVPTIAGVPTKWFIYRFVDGKLFEISVCFEHEQYNQVRRALTAKYGDPASKNVQTYQNAFGATFTGEELQWSNAASTATAVERSGGRLDSSSLIFRHNDLAQLAGKRIESLGPRGKDDL